MTTPPAPSTRWKEDVPADEEARLIAHAEALLAIQKDRAKKTGTVSRGLHAKGNVGVEAELQIKDNLPEYARAGLFAKPAMYRAYVRYSNGAGTREHDARGDVRGVAVKVVGVPGKKIIPGMEDAQTQDFLLIRTPTIPFRNADEFVGVVTAASGHPLLILPRILARVGVGRAFGLLKKISAGMKVPMHSMATTTYYSAAPIRCGDYAMHVSLEPRARAADSNGGDSADWLYDDLKKRLANAPVIYDLRAQFFVSDELTPIEDASVPWKESDAPWVTVGQLTIEQQDLSSERCRKIAEYIETLSFDPWHALVEHRPLGNIMRARNHAYRLSTIERKAAKEPTGSEVF